MNAKPFRCWSLVLMLCLLLTAAHAQDTTPSPESPPAAAGTSTGTAADDGKTTTFESSDQDDEDEGSSAHKHHRHHSHVNDVVSVGHSAELLEGGHADGVVAIFGSATSAGQVDDSVVAVLGNARVTGGRVQDSAVAVMGSTYVNGEVEGDVVAVLGNVELGPEAKVHGDVVVVGGDLKKDPSAVIDGHVQNVLGVEWADFGWVRPWIERCLLYGRPLAFSSGLGWAWGIALALLALYVFIAFAFRGAVDRCVHTLETEPGHSILAAFVLTLGIPVLFVLLFITVLGIAAVPFLAVAVFFAAMFGKVVVLAAIGKRCTPSLANDPTTHTVVGVLVGGLIVLFIYTIPLVGFVVYKLLELLGLGVVVYTLLLNVRAQRLAHADGPGGPTGPGPGLAQGPGGTPGLGGGVGGASFDGAPDQQRGPGEFTWARGAGPAGPGGSAKVGDFNDDWRAGPGAEATADRDLSGGAHAAAGAEAMADRDLSGGAHAAAGAEAMVDRDLFGGAHTAAGAGGADDGAAVGRASGPAGAAGAGASAGANSSSANAGASNMGTNSMGANIPGGNGPGASSAGSGATGGGPPPFTNYGAGASGPAGQPPLNASALPRAGFGIRMAALLLDIILIGIVSHQLHDHGDIYLLALAAYGAVMWKLKGSTIGGIICGVKVVRIDGRPIDWPTAIVRALGCFLSLAVVGLGFIWIAIDHDRQGWHDKIAGTVVVRLPKGASLL